MNHTLRTAIALVALTVGAVAAQGGIVYDVIPIGAAGSGLNNDGVVVGTHGSTDAFYWTESTGRRTFGPTTYSNYGRDINDRGIAVGCTKTTFNYNRYTRYSAFAYDIRTGELITEGVWLTQNIQAINNGNLSTGTNWLRDAPNGSHFQGASYHLDQYGDPFLAGWGDGVGANDINDRNVAVGGYGRVRSPGGMITLTGISGTQAYGINDRWPYGNGLVCGTTDGLPCYWNTGGALHVVDSDGITSGKFRRVNDHGQMVGSARIDGGEEGILYRNGQLVRLNEVLTTSASISQATDINDHGEILVALNASPYGALLRPVYFPDGTFHTDSLTGDWVATGPGLAEMMEAEPGDYCVRLTAGSPVTITQLVSTPDAAFELSYDYEFLSVDPCASLTVSLDGVVVDTITAPAALAGEFTTRTVLVDDPELGVFALDDIPLALTYDGPSGEAVLVDNIRFTQAIPEPTTLALLIIGAVATLRRRSA
jgi:hypothetical protein